MASEHGAGKPKEDWEHVISFLHDGNRKAAAEMPKTNKDKKPVVPKWHLTLNHAWCECPKCRIQPDGLTKWHPPMYGIPGATGYTEYNQNCPWCGQPMLWDWDEIDKASSQSRDWKWATVKEDMTCPGDCIGCAHSKAVGRHLTCIKTDRYVGDDGKYKEQGHPDWCPRIIRKGEQNGN